MLARRLWLLAALVVLAAALLFLPSTSLAHKPIYKYSGEDISDFGKAKVIDNPEVSYAYYAELLPGKVDIYEIYAKQGQTANPALLVPMYDGLQDFTPSMALVGPGLSDNASAGLLPVQVPAGDHAVFIDQVTVGQSRATLFEPLTQTSYWQGQGYKSTYPKDGPYFVVVWDQAGLGGKYVLTLGEKEEFGLGDLVKFPYTWAKLHVWLGDWQALVIAAALILVVAYLVARFVLYRRRRGQAQPAS